jgi:hypothetical protein
MSKGGNVFNIGQVKFSRFFFENPGPVQKSKKRSLIGLMLIGPVVEIVQTFLGRAGLAGFDGSIGCLSSLTK